MSLPIFENYQPPHLSYSSLNGYRFCGEQFKLQRVLRKEQRPGLAGLGGNAVHVATELHDLHVARGLPMSTRPSVEDLFRHAWDAEVAKRKLDSPSFSLDQYIVTGKASAAYGGKRGIEWWMDNGPQMVQRWIDWRENGWQIWTTPEGSPAVETQINVTLPGDTPVLMFLDRIMVTPAGQLVVVDIKTGARMPDVAEQLGLYAVGIEQTWGREFRPEWGYYWDANKGTHSEPKALGMYTADYFGKVYDQAVAGIEAGSFLAKPGNNCFSWCGVSAHCSANPANPSFLQ